MNGNRDLHFVGAKGVARGKTKPSSHVEDLDGS